MTTATKQPPTENLVRAAFPGVEFREAKDGGPPTMVGYLAVFNEWTEIQSFHEGRFMERLSPGAFRKTLKEAKPRVTLNHGHDPDLGDKPLGSILSVNEDERGVRYEVELFRGVPELVVDGLRAGEYGSSFRFSVMDDVWDEEPDRSAYNPEGLPERTLTAVKLMEFGPVTYPAYEGATAGIRSMTDKHGEGRKFFERLPELAHDPLFLEELALAVERMKEARASENNKDAPPQESPEESTAPEAGRADSEPSAVEPSTPKSGGRTDLYTGKKEMESWRL